MPPVLDPGTDRVVPVHILHACAMAAHEVSWSMSEVQRVTLLACLQEAITYFWNRGGDPTAEDVANVVDYLRGNIMTRARNQVRSTDPMQVLCAQADLEAMAGVIQLLESGPLRGP